MSDMRDFNVSEEPINNFTLEDERFSQSEILHASNASLGDFHVAETEESSNTGRIIGALAVALLLGTAGGYAYYSSLTHSTPAPSRQVAAIAPPPAAAPDTSQAVNSPAPAAPSDAAPSSQPASAPAPVAPASSHRIRAARAETGSSSDSAASPVQQQAIAVPDQSVPASNPSLARNEQPGADITPNEAPAIQAQAPAAPVVQSAQPAPAAPADQPAQ